MTAKKQWTLEDLADPKIPERKAIATARLAKHLPHGHRYRLLHEFLIAWERSISPDSLREIVCFGNRLEEARSVSNKSKR